MAKDDYFILVFKILKYLYTILKKNQKLDENYLRFGTKDFPIEEEYWNYILENLCREGYIEGIKLIPILGQIQQGVKELSNIRITPKGIEYVQENNMMKKAERYIREFKDTIPGL